MVGEIKKLFTLISKYGISSENYPSSISDEFDVAIDYKRHGDYLKSLKKVNSLIKKLKCAYTGILNSAFKTIAAAGYCAEARKLLRMCDNVMRNSPMASMWASMGLSNNFAEHLERLDYAIRNERSLIEYLTSISGNCYYQLPRNYYIILNEYNEQNTYY